VSDNAAVTIEGFWIQVLPSRNKMYKQLNLKKKNKEFLLLMAATGGTLGFR
jgi:hypothetical protein